MGETQALGSSGKAQEPDLLYVPRQVRDGPDSLLIVDSLSAGQPVEIIGEVQGVDLGRQGVEL